MKTWGINNLEFDPAVWTQIKAFVEKHPELEALLQERLNDLLEFPDLFWQTARIVDAEHGYFVTRNQQIELAGKVYRSKSLALVTHFSFRR